MAITDRLPPTISRPTASISISHQNSWVEARHGVAFLGPLIVAALRRNSLTNASVNNDFICK
jgi:hypothetical protein